ncbi:MAG: hypothetical protein ACJAV1_003552 [Paraglaciecola sp.]|jgi:hypothetical protein
MTRLISMVAGYVITQIPQLSAMEVNKSVKPALSNHAPTLNGTKPPFVNSPNCPFSLISTS